MSWLNLKYTGSFQSRRYALHSEDPLREVWSSLSLYGSKEFLRTNFKPTNPHNLEWELVLTYASVRIRQAIEFRQASKNGSPLTSPLPLYYSLLNLLRASMSLAFDKLPQIGHGLSFQKGTSLFDSKAILLSKGTFGDYLRQMNVPVAADASFTFKDAVSQIVELRSDCAAITGEPNSSFVVPVRIDAEIGGAVILHFPEWIKNFRESWKKDFPGLAEFCELQNDGNALQVVEPKLEQERDIERFCAEKLEPSLTLRDLNVWSLVRQIEGKPTLPRPACYFISMFILSSIVRYEPELLSEVINPDAQLNWFVQRVLSNAERFFPQLMLWWLNNNKQIYF